LSSTAGVIHSARLTLEPISAELARRIVARDERAGDAWHPEYPFEDELDPLRSLAASGRDASAFGLYLLRRTADGLAVGGFGFFGPPEDDTGTVEFGYGLIASARGAGLATEAVIAGLAFAATRGARRAVADTEVANVASQNVLTKAGLHEVRREGGLVYFARDLVRIALV
jgi:RimJ/RimL family protein N-acetyltransferase